MADYIFSKENHRQLCYWTKHGKLTEIEALIKEVQPKERARFGPTTFCPPLKYMLESPLVNACYCGKFYIVQYFLETFPNIIDVDTLAVIFFNKKTAITPLIAACIAERRDDCDQDSLKIIKYLISKGAKINKSSTDGSTPLRHAHSLETIKYLLECGADINKTCNEGSSLLIEVAGSSLLKKDTQIEILRYLLDNNANVYQCTKNGYTALHMASSSSLVYEVVVKFLLDYGIPPMFTTTSCVTDIDYIPSPAYLAAVSPGGEAIAPVFLQREDCPIECTVDVFLLTAMRRLSEAMYCFNEEEEEKIRFYHIWIKGLEIMKEHNVQLLYPLPVDEYDLREEVKTKEELDAIWGNTLEILFQYALLYERCLGRVCIKYLLEVGDRMIDNGYLKEGESVIERGVLLETSICEKICSKPPNSYPFPRFNITQNVLDELHVLICKLLETEYPLNFQLYIKFGLTALKTKYHLQLPVEPDDKRQVLLLFSMWIKSCESTNSSYPYELISLAKELVLIYLYYPEGSELLLSNCDFIYRYPSLLRLLLEVGGDAVINDVGWDGRTLLQVALKKAVNAYKVERIEEVIRILLEYGAHADTTNRKGLTLFSDIVKSKLLSYKALCSTHLPLSLYCTAANAVVKYCIPYQGLPSHVIDFIKLHDPHYFKQLNYFP